MIQPHMNVNTPRPFPMVEVSLRDKDGSEVPHDGQSLGAVWVCSP